MTDIVTIDMASEAADIAAVAILFRAYEKTVTVDLSFQDFDTEVKTLPGQYGPPHGALLLARDASGQPCGCVGMRSLPMPGRCEMKRLFVEPRMQGFGIGKALVLALIAEARRLGYKELCLDTVPSMATAQLLYKRLGFQLTAPYYKTPIPRTAFYSFAL